MTKAGGAPVIDVLTTTTAGISRSSGKPVVV
jgi:hypothetical protein